MDMTGTRAAPPLPLIPRQLLRRHHAFVESDDRFRSCARLLQCLWREGEQLGAGSLATHRGGTRRLGSLLTPADAATGRNFLTSDLALLARHELIYRQAGALIHEQRFLANALSSQPLALNLFGPMRLNPALAATALRLLMPNLAIDRVIHVAFEYSPGRGHPALTGDASAFDVAIVYLRPDGQRGFVGIEVKYSEGLAEPAPAPDSRSRYDDVAEASGIYKEPATALLRFSGLRQLVREHLLAQASLMRGDYAVADFVLVAPQDNAAITRAAALYAAHLVKPLPGTAPFAFISIEGVIDAWARAGAVDHATALHDRYCDWGKVDRLVADFIRRGAVGERPKCLPRPESGQLAQA